MNDALETLRKLVASFDANQHAIIKTGAHTILEKNRGKIPGFVISWLEKAADGRIDAFLDDSQ